MIWCNVYKKCCSKFPNQIFQCSPLSSSHCKDYFWQFMRKVSTIIQYFLSVSHSVNLTKSNKEVLTALRCSNRFMRVLNPGQFQQVWNFLNFPAKISPRMSVEGERGRRGARTYLALIPADRGHVQSHLSTQPRILAIPYFHRI